MFSVSRAPSAEEVRTSTRPDDRTFRLLPCSRTCVLSPVVWPSFSFSPGPACRCCHTFRSKRASAAPPHARRRLARRYVRGERPRLQTLPRSRRSRNAPLSGRVRTGSRAPARPWGTRTCGLKTRRPVSPCTRTLSASAPLGTTPTMLLKETNVKVWAWG